MITEDYVSFETAKLLKENGFGGECMSMYLTPKPHSGMGNPNEAKIAPHGRDSHYYDGYLYQCEAPTLQMAMKWLREEHKLYINIWADPKDAENDNFDIIFRAQVYNGTSNYGTYEFSTYEHACDASIKYCLEKLI